MDLVLNCSYDAVEGQMCYIDGPIRFTDKGLNENERYLFNKWWEEILNAYGQSVEYYVHGYSLSAHNPFYGEDPTANFGVPQPIIMGIALSNDSMLLSRFGIQATSDFTALVHISSFKAVFGADAEPKSDDLVKLTEFGNDRVNGRGPAIYQITSRDDEEVSQINQLAGHYVWLLRGKRYDYSSEPSAPREQVMDQVYDNAFAGALSSVSVSGDPVKVYDFDVDEKAKEIFDYGANNVNTGVYGDYNQ
jgi:hypothetical protein